MFERNKGIFFLKVVNLCNGKTLADYGITESPLTKELQKTKLVLDKKSGKLTNVKTFKSNPTKKRMQLFFENEAIASLWWGGEMMMGDEKVGINGYVNS